jgi:tetratricopeptide (TPR) repeat protein
MIATLLGLAVCSVSVAASIQEPEPVQNLPQYLAKARAHLDAKEFDEARIAVDQALERDGADLDALTLSSKIAEAAADKDRAVHDLHVWLDLVDSLPKAARDLARRLAPARKLEFARLATLDPEASSWSRLQNRAVSELELLAKDYQKRRDLLGAIEVYQDELVVDPNRAAARKAIDDIRRTGGNEVAVDDVFAGAGDPLSGMSESERRALDDAHSAWENAWTKETDNYRYRTNAGLMVLETSAIAMEQMNRFYRRFFHFMEDGGNTPKIEIRIFKSRDEYLTLGRSPVEWSAGHFIGDAVETYVGGGVQGREGVRDMYRTLFHEAAHQFVSLTGPFVPGWLNEAHASFFEGCTILSNGAVRWNQPPPGRLFPLATRMEGGWMKSTEEAAASGDGSFAEPTTAPPFRMVVEGNYGWGPPWYAPTWGVVYLLWNYRDDEGRAVWRNAMHEYYQSFRRGRPKDAAAHFEEIVLAVEHSPVKKIDEMDALWREFILRLRDRANGKLDDRGRFLDWAQKAVDRGDKESALELLEEARADGRTDVAILEKSARLLEDLGKKPRAAATWREVKAALEADGKRDDPLVTEANEKILKLDALARKRNEIAQRFARDGLALAQRYETAGLPTMGLEILRRLGSRFSVPEVLDFYTALAERTGKSLARWRLAYNERSLEGWSGDSGNYQAYGARIRAHVDGTDDGVLVTRLLVCDVAFDADFSLESEIRVPLRPDGTSSGRLAGLCFGRKGDQDYSAVLLHPNGFLDVSTNRGGVWEIHDHRSVPGGAGEWHKLRIDVAGNSVDFYFDGLFARSIDFPSPHAVRGGFGLVTGPGDAEYRNLRLLARDPRDPAARVERALAQKRILADASLRQPGSFSGFEPPALDLDWVQGEATSLEDLRGRPVMLVFWTPIVERIIPTAKYVQHLMRKGEAHGLETIVVCDGGTASASLLDYLAANPLPGARIGIDRGATLDAYHVKVDGFGMPRILLLRRSGRVSFEGDPGFKSGKGWQESDGLTFVDQPFQALLDDR